MNPSAISRAALFLQLIATNAAAAASGFINLNATASGFDSSSRELGSSFRELTVWMEVPVHSNGCCVFDYVTETCPNDLYTDRPECQFVQAICESSECNGRWISALVTAQSVACPPAGSKVTLTPGLKSLAFSGVNKLCGIYIQSGEYLIPFARSYDGNSWEASPGPLASSQDDIICSGSESCDIQLPPLDSANDGYVILAKDGSTDQTKEIAKFLEMTTFGPRKAEITALDNGNWGEDARANYVRSQINMPATSHREYFRRRTNTKWDSTTPTAHSDHPCSPNSKWRRYTFIKQDRFNTKTTESAYTTFDIVPEEASFVTKLYEADGVNDVAKKNGSFKSGYRNYFGSGYYEVSGNGDWVQWTITVDQAGLYPLSFRFALSRFQFDNWGGNRRMDLYVNGAKIDVVDFFYTGLSGYWKYTDLKDAVLNKGPNTIKLIVVNGTGGSLIDHMRIGKPPAVVIKTNGWPRTIAKNGVGLIGATNFVFNGTKVFFSRFPEPPQGDLFCLADGSTRVALPDGRNLYLDIGNPPVDFTGYEQYLPPNYFTFTNNEVFVTTASQLNDYPLLEGQEYILTTGMSNKICDSIPHVTEEYDAPVFGLLPNGEWLVWSPSILLKDNGPSINTPRGDLASATLVDGGGLAVVKTGEKVMCSNVERTFINEETCKLSTLSTACSFNEIADEVRIPMNTTNVIKFYELSGQYVYAIRGLVMENLNEHPCSKSKSRWEIAKGVTCTSPTSLKAATRTALTDMLSKTTDTNKFTRDVTRTLSCDPSDHNDSSDKLDIQIQVGSDCYKHVHPDHLNVYDFSGWVTSHPGGEYNIQKWAQGWEGHEGWYLTFPFYGNATRKIPQHPMDRWYTNNVDPYIVYVTRLGDDIAYRDLPNELKSDTVAKYFGADHQHVTTGGVIVCGSHGEVSNQPTLNEVFDIRSNVFTPTPPGVMNNQKNVVWTQVNLFSGDQLRQRMAWCLAQILTTVPKNINAYDRTEIYTNYYDIMVRHAFANYRDILAEISYSPLMAEHLSYLKSKSHAYVYQYENKRVSSADENYAREVMQLFSIGLIKMNDDGTPQLDMDGNPIEVYTNEDVESFARAWTGFVQTGFRANIEQTTFSGDNKLDPLKIEPDWRDAFPKSNLNGGFIGDGYELCSDIPTQSFLKRGARYRLLGGSSSPELMKDTGFFSDDTQYVLRAELDSSSPLYQRLYNGGNYDLNVVLENDLACNGIECMVDTLRVVKIGNVYFEFVPKPCIQLAFYNDGKQIQLRSNKLQGQMCANPNLAHARGACCRQERYLEVRSGQMKAGVAHFYDGERMTFATAKDRCGSLCVYKGIADGADNEWFRKGYHWTPKDCAINVKVNSEGYVAIAHDVSSSYKDTVPYHVDEANTLNWFRVFWDGSGDYPGSSSTNTCAANSCKTMFDGSCLCKTLVTESVVFTDIDIVSKDSALSQLHIGTEGPEADSIPNIGNGFTAHIVGGVIDENTVFEVEDKGRKFFLKNIRSTVNLKGWEKIPEILEAEDATIYNAVKMTDTSSAIGGSYVKFASQSYVEWHVSVNAAKTYLISFRYALDSPPTPLSIFANSVEVKRQATNPTIPFVDYGGTPPAGQLPLRRCEGHCKSDSYCADGLICKQNNALEENPGCAGGTQKSGNDYCVDPADYTHGVLFYPTGGWSDDWLYSDPLEVTLLAGQNVIRAQVPSGYTSGPNIDHMKIERLTSSAQSSSFRNPPHFMSLIPDYAPYGIGEQTLRDAQYETDAVLDNYFFQDNVAPFLCVRIIQRFGATSNPSPRYVSECTKAFKTGSYMSGSITFGSGKYGDLEATVAAIVLDREATSPVVTSDPSHGSIKEPIMKVLALMRSMEYQTKIPDTLAGPPMHNDFKVELWQIDQKIGQGPYEFPSVFSFFLPEYIPDSGPALRSSFTSPESMLITMPNVVALLNGMFSLIKYGLGDCNGGFSTYPGYSSCSDNGRFERSFGRLFYEPEGTNVGEQIADLALLLTAGRLSDDNRATIEHACSSEPDRASITRCVQQLIVTTGEFHSTSHATRSGADRTTPSTTGTSTEPYKAIIYLDLEGGCDSYNMLVPHTCAPIDVYDKYRQMRGKSDTSEGIGLPKDWLLEIQANDAGQPCTSFGIHKKLTVLKKLYDQQDAIFIANAGLLEKSIDVSNYSRETSVQLFAHNAMSLEAKREDLEDKYLGTGIGGRMADVLTQEGIPTNTFSISGHQVLLTGKQGKGPSQIVISSSGLSGFNAEPSIANMNDMIQNLNNATTNDSGFFAETWSSKLSEAMAKHGHLKVEVDSTLVTAVFPSSDIAAQLRLVTQLMQTADARGVKRDIFYVTDGGYDAHGVVIDNLVNNFGRIDAALDAFVTEVKTLNLWEATTLVQFSEFGRSLDPNTGGGSDHGWGGIHFMLGGSVNGGKVLGRYPNDFEQSDKNPIALSRGRMIPTHPWDAMWYGTTQWFGIIAEADIDKVLPLHKNFNASLLYDASQLFVGSGLFS